MSGPDAADTRDDDPPDKSAEKSAKDGIETPDEPFSPDVPARPKVPEPTEEAEDEAEDENAEDADETGTLSTQLKQNEHFGDITAGLIVGPAEMVSEFDDAGNAAAAKANLDIYMRWIATGVTDKAPPAVALIVNQSKLDPVEDRPRKVDFPTGFPPKVWIEGPSVVLDAPRSKQARDIIRKVYKNSKPKRIFDRPKRGGMLGGGGSRSAGSAPAAKGAAGTAGGAGAGGSKTIAIVAGVVLLLAAAAAGAYFMGLFK